MSKFLLSRRSLIKAAAALGLTAAVAPDELLAEEEPVRRFWQLDQRHTGIREFHHISGFARGEYELPISPCMEDTAVSLRNMGPLQYVDMGWEVEKVLSSGKNLYRIRIVDTETRRRPIVDEIHPLPKTASNWMSPADAEAKHGIIVRRFA